MKFMTGINAKSMEILFINKISTEFIWIIDIGRVMKYTFYAGYCTDMYLKF